MQTIFLLLLNIVSWYVGHINTKVLKLKLQNILYSCKTIKIYKFNKYVDITYTNKKELFNECNTFKIKGTVVLILIMKLQKRINLLTQIHLNLGDFLNLTLLQQFLVGVTFLKQSKSFCCVFCLSFCNLSLFERSLALIFHFVSHLYHYLQGFISD